MVHQELAFCENLSVAENLTLGRVPGRAGFVSRSRMRDRARAMLEAIDADLDVDRLVGDLTTGQQQMVQIAAALGRGARIVVFDEPTSSLSQHEAERLFAVIRPPCASAASRASTSATAWRRSSGCPMR